MRPGLCGVGQLRGSRVNLGAVGLCGAVSEQGLPSELHGRVSAALRFRCGGGWTERSAAILLGVALLALLLSASSVNASHGTVSVST